MVSVSGGMDSLSLLHLLYDLREDLRVTLHVFHLNHMIRGEEAEEDMRFVKDFAQKLNLPCTALSFDVSAYVAENRLSLEEGAREVRYMLLEKVADEIKADKIVLGHHRDDNVETFLMRILRGAGAEGLRGILPVRGKCIRPLIEVGKEEIENYCQINNLEFRVDTSNLSLFYERNKIRHKLIPVLEEYNPKFKEIISNTIEILDEENAYLSCLAEECLAKLAEQSKDLIKISSLKLLSLPLAIQRRLARKIIELIKGDLRGIEFKHIEKVLEGAAFEEKSFQMDLPGDLVVFSEQKKVVVAKKETLKKPSLFEQVLKVPGKTEIEELRVDLAADFVDNKGLVIKNDKSIAYLDADKLKFPLKVRTRRLGDRFKPLGMQEEKKLHDFFIDEKVVKRERDRVPLVLSGEQIVWVVGYRIDDDFKVDSKTRKVLEICLKEKRKYGD